MRATYSPSTLGSLSSAQAEVDPPAERHAGGDAMAATNLCHAGTSLLRFLHDRSLLLVADATALRSAVHRLRSQAVLAPCAISSAA